jgi:hypothetical protein
MTWRRFKLASGRMQSNCALQMERPRGEISDAQTGAFMHELASSSRQLAAFRALRPVGELPGSNYGQIQWGRHLVLD